MKILLTGANGYVGKRLLPALIAAGHQVVCCVRDRNRFSPPAVFLAHLEVVEVDFLKPETLAAIPSDIEGAYYLIHSMSNSRDFDRLELRCAQNFVKAMKGTQVQQVIYLSGIVNEEALSRHLASRKAVEDTLAQASFACTTLRAGIIIGSGSASFEIMRDLAEKLPLMIAPKWLNTRCQPIGIRDVISFLSKSLFRSETYNRSFDIGGPDVVSYKEMLQGYAKVRGLKRWFLIVPVMTPKLSSYWLYFITSTSYQLATSLVNSMKIEVICRDQELNNILTIKPLSYEQALQRTLDRVDRKQVPSSWKDSLVSGVFDLNLSNFVEVPTHACFQDQRSRPIRDRSDTVEKIWSIGGETGWYHSNWLWRLRGLLDKVWGGVGLRRGRTNQNELAVGDAVDFWRVLHANQEEGRLLLFAEMKLPGEAWLEFRVQDGELRQTATFRPKGIWGRLYWFAVLPFHGIVFNGMIKQLAK